jgi:methionyl-tRNA formyltransferase
MNIVFMGTPEFAVPILEMLKDKHQVLLVVTQPDKMVGRKKVLSASPVKTFAIKNKLNLFQPEKLMTNYQKIIDLKPDFIITAAYGQMLPKELLEKVEAINVHGSILPKYRGGAPIQYALFNGDQKTGVTIMYMAFKMDSGDIIKQEEIEIDPKDHYQSLSQKLSVLGARLLDEVLQDILSGKINRYPQNTDLVTFAYTLKRLDEYINFNSNTDVIINRLRGLYPEPGGYSITNSQMIKIYQAKKSDIIIDNQLSSGTIIEVNKKLIVKTKDGAIEILTLQVPGKKQMDAASFLNGQSLIKKYDQFKERDE